MNNLTPIPLSPSIPSAPLQPDERPYRTRSTSVSAASEARGTASRPDTRTHQALYDPAAASSRIQPNSKGRPAPLCLNQSNFAATVAYHPQSRHGPLANTRPSLIDELLPTPCTSLYTDKMRGLPLDGHEHDHNNDHVDARAGTSSHAPVSSPAGFARLLRRSGSIGVLFCFLLVASWFALTDQGAGVERMGVGLREALGSSRLGVPEIMLEQQQLGSSDANGSESPASETDAHGHGHGSLPGDVEVQKGRQPDYDQYIMLRTLSEDMVSVTSSGKRLIIIGDIHGSFIPLHTLELHPSPRSQLILRNLLSRLSYSPQTDTLLHVGDLLAKGPKPLDVLTFMHANDILGVRGNHDQPVVRWRAWMHHAGGIGWEEMMDQVGKQSEKEAREYFEKKGKGWPEGKGWEWRGEHWKIARSMSTQHYQYLLSLPLALHMPSLHTVIVHAGIVPYNLKKSPNASSQPLIVADRNALLSGPSGSQDSAPSPSEESDNGQSVDHDTLDYVDDDVDIPDQLGASTDTHGHGRPPGSYSDSQGQSLDAHGHGRPATPQSEMLRDGSSIETNSRAARSSSLDPARLSPRKSDLRLHTELSILTALPQNTSPYTLIEMRSLYTKGKKQGTITKSAKKGTAWGKVWNREMKRCTGPGAWGVEEEEGELRPTSGWGIERSTRASSGEYEIREERRMVDGRDGSNAEEDESDDDEDESDDEQGDVNAEGKKLKCSPFTVIYGHAAGRGLDIRPFSKGIDTGCVYGKSLTALVLGDTKGLRGEAVQVDKHKGVLVSVKCKSGGSA